MVGDRSYSFVAFTVNDDTHTHPCFPLPPPPLQIRADMAPVSIAVVTWRAMAVT